MKTITPLLLSLTLLLAGCTSNELQESSEVPHEMKFGTTTSWSNNSEWYYSEVQANQSGNVFLYSFDFNLIETAPQFIKIFANHSNYDSLTAVSFLTNSDPSFVSYKADTPTTKLESRNDPATPQTAKGNAVHVAVINLCDFFSKNQFTIAVALESNQTTTITFSLPGSFDADVVSNGQPISQAKAELTGEGTEIFPESVHGKLTLEYGFEASWIDADGQGYFLEQTPNFGGKSTPLLIDALAPQAWSMNLEMETEHKGLGIYYAGIGADQGTSTLSLDFDHETAGIQSAGPSIVANGAWVPGSPGFSYIGDGAAKLSLTGEMQTASQFSKYIHGIHFENTSEELFGTTIAPQSTIGGAASGTGLTC